MSNSRQFKQGDVVFYACSGGGLDFGVIFSQTPGEYRPYKAVSAWGRIVNRHTTDYLHAVREDMTQGELHNLQITVDKYCVKKKIARILCRCKY